MKIKILSDSTCDLSKALLEKYDIGITPLIVVKNDQEYHDGVTIQPQDIFDHVAGGGAICTTAALSVGTYQDAFARYAADYDGIIHINIGSGFSSSYQNATLAAEEFDNVRVIDSQNLSTGQGLVVLKACELAKTAESLDALAEQLREFAQRVEASFVVEQLAYLVKGGRCSSAVALGANLLNLKPCIEVKGGKMSVGKKYRGSFEKCLANYVKDRLSGREDLDPETIFITYTPVSDGCLDIVRAGVADYGNFRNVYETTAGCTISCHCGPGTLGILFVRK